MSDRSWRVVVVDDHLVTRQGIRLLIEMTGLAVVVGEAENGDEALALSEGLSPDLVFLDLNMPGKGGLEVLRSLKALDPAPHVMILTVDEEGPTVVEAVRSGASGYLSKSAGVYDFERALQSLDSSGVYMSPSVTGHVMRALADGLGPSSAPTDVLTSREFEVLRLLSDGLTARTIGRRLGISERTVNTHIGNMYRRMGVTNRVDAVKAGMRIGLLEPPR